MLREELRNIVKKQQSDLMRDLGVRRNTKIKLIDNFATIISGVRRCGKSTLARQYLRKRTPVYYLYFEDIALADFRVNDFTKVEDIFRELFDTDGVFFFDEIQNVIGWERYVRNLVDPSCSIFASLL